MPLRMLLLHVAIVCWCWGTMTERRFHCAVRVLAGIVFCLNLMGWAGFNCYGPFSDAFFLPAKAAIGVSYSLIMGLFISMALQNHPYYEVLSHARDASLFPSGYRLVRIPYALPIGLLVGSIVMTLWELEVASTQNMEEFPMVGLAMMGVSGIPWLAMLYRAWTCIPDGKSGITPDRAMRRLFIPLFNIYWGFRIIKELPSQLNRLIRRHRLSSYSSRRHRLSRSSPRWLKGLAMVFWIVHIAWWVFYAYVLVNQGRGPLWINALLLLVSNALAVYLAFSLTRTVNAIRDAFVRKAGPDSRFVPVQHADASVPVRR